MIIVVFLGRAHAGLVSTIDYIATLTGQEHLHAVLVGMHLVRASDERIARTVKALTHRGVQILGPAHCTGRTATMRLWQCLSHECVECMTGARFVFG